MGNANFVLRLIKHNRNTFQSSLNHSTRHHIPENINPAYSHLNRNITVLNNEHYEDSSRKTPTGLKAEITHKAKEQIDNRVGKLRKNAVYAVEFVISASHEHLESMSHEEQQAYFNSGIDYIRERFGDDNFLSAHIHYDERTPHAHIFFSAVTFDDKKQKHKTHFKHFIDGPVALGKFQDDFHSNVAQRYQMNPNKKKQRISHTKLTQFYDLVEKNETTSLKDLDYDELDKAMKKVFRENSSEAHTGALNNYLNTLSNLSEKSLSELNIDDFNMFTDVLNMTSIQNLIKRSMQTQIKKREVEKKKQAEREKYEHERAVHLARIQQFSQEWIRHRDSLIDMVKTGAIPMNDIEIAFKERLSNLEQAYQAYLNTEKLSNLAKRKIAAYLRTPDVENDLLQPDEKLSRLSKVYHATQPKKGNEIAAYITGNQKGFEYFCQLESSYSHPKDWVAVLVEKIIAFFTGIKIPSVESQSSLINQREREHNVPTFTM